MQKKAIYSESAAAPIGPYSQAIRAHGTLIFTSGQIPLDRQGNMVAGGIAEQTHAVMANLRAILSAGGSGLEHVIKTTVYLQDMADFAAMNEVYKTYFSGGQPPARTTIQVARLPKDAKIEIEAVAVVPE